MHSKGISLPAAGQRALAAVCFLVATAFAMNGAASDAPGDAHATVSDKASTLLLAPDPAKAVAPAPTDTAAKGDFREFVSMEAQNDTARVPERESIFPERNRPLWLSHFTWGIDVGTSVDLRGYDMSTVDLDVMIGYKSRFIRTVGIGAGVHRSFGSHNTFYPLYAVLRTSFRSKPSLFFFNLRAGYAFATLHNGVTRGGITGALGVGVNLAMSKRFQSHILLSYCYYQVNGTTRNEINLPISHIDLARISFGVNF